MRLQTPYLCYLSKLSLVHYAMHSPSQRCLSSRQITDNIFEIETTALAHVACAPQDSGVLLTDFAAAYPSVNHSWIFSVLENTGLPDSSLPLPTKHVQGQHYTRGICGNRKRTIPHGQRSTTRLSCEWLSCCNGLWTRFSDGSKNRLSQGTSTTWNSYSLHKVLTLTNDYSDSHGLPRRARRSKNLLL